MRFTKTRLLLGALLVLAVAGAAGAEVQLSNKAEFAETSRATGAVRAECNLQTVLPSAIADAASEVKLVEGKASGERLDVKITDVQAPGGGPFSGPKWLEVTGAYHAGGKKYTFRAKRTSVAPFGGTCGMLQKCARSIGSDIALWMIEPTGNAALGDAR